MGWGDSNAIMTEVSDRLWSMSYISVFTTRETDTPLLLSTPEAQSWAVVPFDPWTKLHRLRAPLVEHSEDVIGKQRRFYG
jgi:hypothetical protein